MSDLLARRSWDHAAGAPVVRVDPLPVGSVVIYRGELGCPPRPCAGCGFTVASRPCSTACTARTPFSVEIPTTTGGA